MFNKNYYENKKAQLQSRLTKKVFDFYNGTKQLLVAIDGDLAELQKEQQELEMLLKENKDVEPTIKKENNSSKLPK